MPPAQLDKPPNLAGSIGEAEGLRSPVEVRQWTHLRGCGIDDAFRVAGVVGHGIRNAKSELHAVLQDAYDRWTWERAVTRRPALALVGGPPLTAPLKLAALAHVGRTSRTERAAVSFHGNEAQAECVVVGTVFAGPQLPALSGTCSLAVAQIHKCSASEESRRGNCKDVDLEKWLNRMPVLELAGTL